MEEKRDIPSGFMIYQNSLCMLKYLDEAGAGRVIKAVAAYFLTGEAPEGMTGAEAIVCEAFCRDVDRSLERYRTICARNRENRRKTMSTSGEIYVLPDGEPD